MRRARNIVLFGTLALCLSGCDTATVSGTQTDFGKLGILLFHEIAGIGSSASVARDRAAAIPYASLGVRLGGSDESMFVLASKSGSDLLWLGGKTVAVTTRNGRAVRTIGLPHNISGVQAGEGVKQDFTQATVNYLYDFAEEARYGVPVRCVRQNRGNERIVIIGVTRDTMHVAEDCNASTMDWSFRNEFWIDGAGYVWKSRQFVHPKLDPLELESLRPAAG